MLDDAVVVYLDVYRLWKQATCGLYSHLGKQLIIQAYITGT